MPLATQHQGAVEAPMPFRASPSKLTLFRQCPRRYWFEERWRVDPENGRETVEEVRARAAEIAAERAFPPRPGPLCAGCDYCAICPAGQRFLAVPLGRRARGDLR